MTYHRKVKMRIQRDTILVAVVALCVGAALGWFTARCGKSESEDVLASHSLGEGRGKHVNMEAANGGRGRSQVTPNEKAKPRRKAESRRTAEVHAEKFNEPQPEPVVKPTETPVQEEVAAQQKKDEDPFSRYLDMFKNNPEALAAEFQKEVEKERASLAKVREHAIEELKLNAEQVAVFEKALDDLRDEVTRLNEEWVGLIRSGQLNDRDDGSILTSNRLQGQRFVAAREKAMRETSEKLYEQLELDGFSDAEKQAWLFIAAHRTASSIECFEPKLAVYDKVYKNYGMGNGIFSWCTRQSQKK